MELLQRYGSLLEKEIARSIPDQQPDNLYDPLRYILSLGGKRLRPVLTLFAADVFGNASERAVQAALAVELFHNFSLIHDDIMDDAPLRRGKQTVHEKWDVNTGILSGDALLILAYRLFEGYPPELFRDLAGLFSKTAMEVCEGQQYDMDFETRNDVTIPEYLTMIQYKTAVLVGAALKMGAMVAGASGEDQDRIYDFGMNLGLAFQLQDDYLDAFGDPETFGKQVGGDILANKKTYLYLKALELGSPSQQEALSHQFNGAVESGQEKVDLVKDLFEQTGATNSIQQAISDYTQQAYQRLDGMALEDQNKAMLRGFGDWLMKRNV